MLEFALYIILRHILAHIKASFAGAGITLLTDISAARLLLLVLIQSLGSTDGQVSVPEGCPDFVLSKSRQIHFQFISCI